MPPTDSPDADSLQPSSAHAACSATSRKLIRGSSLLTIGRMIAIVLNFLVQVITVRCLTKAEYGAFEFGISMASMGSSLAVCGLGRALNRFVPVYQERGEFGRLAGTVVLSLGCVAALGTGVVLLVLSGRTMLAGTLVTDQQSLSLLMILILLTPLRALDSIFEELFAALSNPKALFFRRHLLGPLLKLAALIPLVLFRTDARVLSISYVIGGVIGTTCSAVVLWSQLRRAGLQSWFHRSRIEIPARSLFGFSGALLSGDLLVIARSSFVTLILEFCHGALGVAAFRAVLPLARLNTFVADSFRFLFSPVISRLVARGDSNSVDRIFWQTTTWIAVATFPLLLTCLSLAELITVTMFGREYADSAGILRLLSAGFFVSGVFGFNYEVLKAHGRIGRMLVTDVTTVVAAIALNILLVPAWGAVGGAAATVLVMLMRPVWNQVTLFRLGILRTIDWQCVRLFLLMAAVALIAILLPALTGRSTGSQFLVLVAGTLAVLYAGLPVMDVENVFPELMRLKPVRRLLWQKGT